MTITREDTEALLMGRPGLREAVADWEKRRRPGQLAVHADEHGVTVSADEAAALEHQSLLRQSAGYSARAVRVRT
jgi:hypothetical protein